MELSFLVQELQIRPGYIEYFMPLSGQLAAIGAFCLIAQPQPTTEYSTQFRKHISHTLYQPRARAYTQQQHTFAWFAGNRSALT